MTLRFLLPLAVLAATFASPAHAADDYSAAEKALFMSDQLSTLHPPATLRYAFSKGGSLEENFEDKVAIQLSAKADGACCAAKAEFLAGPRKLTLPDLESAQGNPAILYFLERDIREMQRLTKGQANYFRKRIRMAVYQAATISQLSVPWGGKDVAARQIAIAPYVDDPLRARFEKFANKQYVFTLSDEVPGGVYAIRTRIDAGPDAKAPLLVEEMLLDGAVSAAAAPRNP
jgi:hypothetical protein